MSTGDSETSEAAAGQQSTVQAAQTAGWFYQLMGLPTGPVPLERLTWMVERGHLTGASLVRDSADGEWVTLESVPDLSSLLAPSDTPAPQTTPPEETAQDSPPLVEDNQADAAPTQPPPRTVSPTRIPSPVTRRPARDKSSVKPTPGKSAPPDMTVPSTAAPREAPANEPTADDVELEFDSATELDAGPANDPSPGIAIQPDAIDTPDVDTSPAAPEVAAPGQTPFTGVRDVERSPGDSVSASRKLLKKAGKRPGLRELLGKEKPEDERKDLSGLAAVIQPALRYWPIPAAALVVGGILWAVMPGNDEKAAETFQRVFEEYQAKRVRPMDQSEWNAFVLQARDDVALAIEPVMDKADADHPRLQSLLWAAQELTILLSGTREPLPAAEDRFKAYMDDYNGVPEPTREDNGENRVGIDPIPGEGPQRPEPPGLGGTARPGADPALGNTARPGADPALQMERDGRKN